VIFSGRFAIGGSSAGANHQRTFELPRIFYWPFLCPFSLCSFIYSAGRYFLGAASVSAALLRAFLDVFVLTLLCH
jgi:hypothetical protein